MNKQTASDKLFVSRTLSNGIRLAAARQPKFKTTTLKAIFHVPLDEKEYTANALVPMVLTRGSGKFPDMASISMFLEKLYGASFKYNVYKFGARHVLEFSLAVLADQYALKKEKLLEQALAFLIDVLTNPLKINGAFKSDYVSQEKANQRKHIESLIDNKARYARFRCLQEMCANEPCRLFEWGSLDQLAVVDEAAVARAYQRMLAGPCYLYALGDIEPESVLDGFAGAFSFKRGRELAMPDEPVISSVKKAKTLRELEQIEQAKLVMGYRTGITVASPDYFDLMMYLGVLGAFPTSKLFMNVREKESLCYYVSSGAIKSNGIMLIQSGIDTDKYDAAVDSINRQLEAVAAGKISDEEIEHAYASFENEFVSEQDSPGAIIEQHHEMEVLGRDLSPEEILRRLRGVTRDGVQKVAKKVKLDTVFFLSGGTS